MSKFAAALALLLMASSPAAAQDAPCRFLCTPALLFEPTLTLEDAAAQRVFEATVVVDIPTRAPRIGISLEAITKPFIADNSVELESELNFTWLEDRRTGGWVSSHLDLVDKFSPAERDTDRRAYTHKLNFELDTAIAVFNRLPEGKWLRGVALEGSLDYVATGLSKDSSPWSFSLVLVIPVI